ncbi:MAG: rhodanese-like domain-containing protein [Aeromonas sp.]
MRPALLFALLTGGSALSLPALAALPIDRDTLRGWLQRDTSPLLLDLRSRSEYDSGHLPGARPLSGPLPVTDALKGMQQRPVVLYHSRDQALDGMEERLERAGFEKVYHLHGGWQSWLAADLPVEHFR